MPVALLAVVTLTAAGSARYTLPHLALRRSEPADSSVLAVAPERISLWFTAKPQLAFSRITLTGPRGTIALDTVVADTGNALHARIPRALETGEYVVVWRTTSADGHPIQGRFRFAIGAAPSATTDAAPDVPAHAHADAPASPQIEPRFHTDYRSARWVEFVALMTILGALGFRHGVLPPLASRAVPTADAADRARRLGQGALFLYALAAAVRLYSESLALNGAERALDPDAVMSVLTQTTWGMGWMTGILGAALVTAGWLLARRTAIGTPLALTGALGMVASPALTGHAASSEMFVVAVTLDMLHVLAAGAWIGGLLMVVVAGIPAMRRLADGNPDAAVGALVSSFHPVALFCAPIVVAAGIGTSILRLGDLQNLFSTRFGYALLAKLGLFALLAGVALFNATRGRRQLGSGAATRMFRRSAALELLFAALVLAATSFLVTTPAPSLMAE